jgi:hypothetical protein
MPRTSIKVAIICRDHLRLIINGEAKGNIEDLDEAMKMQNLVAKAVCDAQNSKNPLYIKDIDSSLVYDSWVLIRHYQDLDITVSERSGGFLAIYNNTDNQNATEPYIMSGKPSDLDG